MKNEKAASPRAPANLNHITTPKNNVTYQNSKHREENLSNFEEEKFSILEFQKSEFEKMRQEQSVLIYIIFLFI